MMRNSMFGAGAAALLLVAAPLAAQEAQGEVAAESFARAEAAGVPLSLLESKVAEGRAKGVAMATIEAAIERRTEALIAASDALAEAGVEGASEADLSVAADALEGGVSAEVLQTISTTAPTERRAVAIAALTYLVAEGEVPEEALIRVETALQAGPEALANLAAEVGVGADAPGLGVGAEAGADGNAGVDAGGPPVELPVGRP
ncbi:MAG: hypothetical protein ACODAB_04860 [Gemmatimonadota bacterium]